MPPPKLYILIFLVFLNNMNCMLGRTCQGYEMIKYSKWPPPCLAIGTTIIALIVQDVYASFSGTREADVFGLVTLSYVHPVWCIKDKSSWNHRCSRALLFISWIGIPGTLFFFVQTIVHPFFTSIFASSAEENQLRIWYFGACEQCRSIWPITGRKVKIE